MQTDADTKPQSKLDMALHWAARGFHVFPVEADGKQPVTSNGLYDATTDPETIRNWWQCPLTGSAMDWNIGASPRDGRHVVVDLDVKGGRNGIAEYEALGGVVGGLVTQTPSGGRHVWLTGPDTQNTAGTVAPGVDTRGSTGHVLMPGSTINGAAYEVVSDDPILPAPDWLLTRVPLRTERDRTRIVVTMVENDQPPNVERFTEHCRRAEPAVAGVFHDLSRNLAAEATRCAVSVEKAIEVMLAEWVPRCSGFFEDGRNERWPADVAASYAWAMGFREHGIHSVDAERLAFEGVSIVPPPPDTATTPAAGCGETTDSPMYAGWRRVCSTSLAGQPIPPREWLVDQWLSPDHVTVLFGEGGAGKSILMQQLMLACATGRDWLGLRTTPCATYGLFCEDSEEELHRRQAGLCRLLGVDLADTGRMSWISGADTENELVVFDRNGRMELTSQFRRLLHETEDTGARLVTVDTGACTFGGDENIRRQVTPFVRVALGRIARATNAAVVLTLHPSRSGINRGDPDGGSTAWTGSARARWTLSRARGEIGAVDPAERVLALPKSNYSVDCAELRMRRVSEGFVPVVPLTVAETRARDVNAEVVFLKLLNRWNLQGRNLSPHSQASTYAAKVLATQPDREGLLRSDFEGAMDRLFREGRLMTEMWGPPSNRKQRVVPTPGR